MELRRYLALLRRRLLLLIALVLVAVAVAAATTLATFKHQADVVLYVGSAQFDAHGGSASGDETLLAQALLPTYAQMLKSEPIAAAAVREAHVDRRSADVLSAMDVTPVDKTQLLTVTVRDRDPVIAQRLANSLADQFVARVRSQDKQPGPGSLPNLPAYVFQPAELPSDSALGPVLRNVVLAGLFGLAVGVGLVILLEQLDVTVRAEGDAEERLQLPVLGSIPYAAPAEGTQAGALLARRAPVLAQEGPSSEAG